MQQLIRSASELRAASGVAASVLDLTKNDNFRIADLVKLIERDPALTARMLSAVNACQFGFTRQISNLQQALPILGQRKLRSIALSFSIINTFSSDVDEKVYRDFWRRSLTTSLVADRLSTSVSNVDRNDAYVAGLLADIGILALAQLVPEVYLPVYEQAHDTTLADAERDVFGFDHAEFGACLLEVWEFPQVLSSAVTDHHNKEKAKYDGLVRLLLAGNLVPNAIWLAQASAFEAAFSCFEQFFQFDIQRFIDLALEVNQAVAREAEAFQIGGLRAVDGDTLEIIKDGFGLSAHC
ncbi:MAG: HDOD domain-containing protein [Planctomycetales bacterium]|nr:HDOD domain-containing protein [Planctomycetales bacterium]